MNDIEQEILDAHPILAYRVKHFLEGRNVRGVKEKDTNRCNLMMDDSVVAGDYHFPCVIYMREKGEPIGKVNPNMRQDRIEFIKTHDCHKDPICKKNCLDVCIDYNNRYKELRCKK